MSRHIVVNDEPTAQIVYTPEGQFLVPQLLVDDDGQVPEGMEWLNALRGRGMGVSPKPIEDATLVDPAWLQERLEYVSQQLGIPIHPKVQIPTRPTED